MAQLAQLCTNMTGPRTFPEMGGSRQPGGYQTQENGVSKGAGYRGQEAASLWWTMAVLQRREIIMAEGRV